MLVVDLLRATKWSVMHLLRYSPAVRSRAGPLTCSTPSTVPSFAIVSANSSSNPRLSAEVKLT